ncbi:chitin synthase chs-2-like [Pollicipes pollicipes]|uniref:chitin synthase chs-2-like n=1 Tax=Pollicipes pollicipes TaxID=41117 RepID=UPI0018851C63|nr:chitin synthase chs-2-like [Pollicipes pollicipes]
MGTPAAAWAIPTGLILTSFGWWENYVVKKRPVAKPRKSEKYTIFEVDLSKEDGAQKAQARVGFLTFLGNIKYRMSKTRYIIYLFVSLWKIALFFGMMVLLMSTRLDDPMNLFTEMKSGFANHTLVINETGGSLENSHSDATDFSTNFMQTTTIISSVATPAYVWLVQLFGAYLAYITGKFACKIWIQTFSFALPVSLAVPCSLSLMLLLCGLRADDACCFHGKLPPYLFFECPRADYIDSFLAEDCVWLWVLWLFSQAWITMHMWTPHCFRLAPTEVLFVTPMYNSLLIDQSLAMNRRRDDDPDLSAEDFDIDADLDGGPKNGVDYISTHSEASGSNSSAHHSDSITRILACATMWHEERNEMLLMLQSVAHMDYDQSARRCMQKYLRIVDSDYYHYKTHIFFDDAFQISDDETEEQNEINRYVRQLIECIDVACSNVHGVEMTLPAPTKTPTPYGGRLVWTLPGKTEIVVHLKDKSLIRHRKRWSQVMYMYYLLGFKLMEQDIAVERKEVIAENTYLLALDGDIDFMPDAVKLLVDLMKKNQNLGAACGRIHPVGSGPMVWYQLFEYAIGHWLQKATEHMIGCVLCSPGCFSLFRAKGLMDDNVMKTYTTPASEARHYVQYDQGEDRWLCTLLLQRGYRVEYCAASDAYTHAPEGFNEFYNQRRRWVPSTMANILDLLKSHKRTVRVNDNISTLYVLYQVMLMVGTVLGPGTIFLMLIGSFNAAFGISNWYSLLYNAIPVVIFMAACVTVNSKIQLLIAQLLTAVYTIVMVIVIVGLALQFAEEGMESPTAIFFIATMGSFVLTAAMHPLEFYCLPALVVYYITVPSMYFLLIVYSFTNMNNVTWGTREVAVKTRKSDADLEAEKKALEAAKKQPGGILGFLYQFNTTAKDDDGSVDFSLGNVFRCMCCTHPKEINEREQLKRIADSIDSINKRMDSLEGTGLQRLRSTSRSSARGGRMSPVRGPDDPEERRDEPSAGLADSGQVHMKKRDLLKNPLWVEDKLFAGKGSMDLLSQNEIEFWEQLIKTYLYPLIENKEEKARIAAELDQLRTTVCFFFMMVNVLFVVAIFILETHQDELHLNWPLGAKNTISFSTDTVGRKIQISQTYLQLEPIGFVFVMFFALILVIQFTAMMFHRFGTISQILSLVTLSLCGGKKSRSGEDLLRENGLQMVRDMQRMKNRKDSEESNRPQRRQTVSRLVHERTKSKKLTFSLDDNFIQHYDETANNMDDAAPSGGRASRMSKRRATMKAMVSRRQSVMNERRRQSQVDSMSTAAMRSRSSPSTPSTSSQLPNERYMSRGGYDNDIFENSSGED